MFNLSVYKRISFILIFVLTTLSCSLGQSISESEEERATPTTDTFEVPSPAAVKPLQAIGPDNVTELEQAFSFVSDYAYDLVWDPNQNWIAVSTPTEIKIYELENLQLINVLPDSATDYPGIMGISPDGNYLASIPDKEGDVIVWDTKTWKKRYVLPTSRGGIDQIAFSPDSQLMAYISNGIVYIDNKQEGSDDIYLVDTESGEIKKVLHSGTGTIKGIAFSPDGKTLASISCCGSGEPDNYIRLWDINDGNELYKLDTFGTNYSYNLYFSPNGERLISGAGTWDLATRQIIDFNLLEYMSPDGRYEASINSDGNVYVNKVDGQSETINLKTGDMPQKLVFSPDGRKLATIGDSVSIWNLENTPPFTKVFQNVDGELFALSPNGALLVMVRNHTEPMLFDVDTGAETILAEGEIIDQLKFSGSGSLLAISRKDKSVEIWNLDDSKIVSTLKDVQSAEQLNFIGKDSLLVTSNSLGGFGVWDVNTGKNLWDSNQNAYPFMNFAISDDQKYIAVRESGVTSQETVFRVYDVTTSNEVDSITIDKDLVTAFTIIPNENLFIYTTINAEGQNSDLIFYDTKNQLETDRKQLDLLVSELLLFDQGQSLALVGTDVSFWDLTSRSERFRVENQDFQFGTLEELNVFNDHFLLMGDGALLDTWTGKILCSGKFTFSIGKQTCASAESNTIFISDFSDNGEISRFTAHDRAVSNLTMAPSGNILFSGSKDLDEIKIWDTHTISRNARLGGYSGGGLVAFSPDHSTLIYSSRSKLSFLDLDQGTALDSLNTSLVGISGWTFSPGFAFTRDGNYLVTFDIEPGRLMIWDAQLRKLMYSYNIEEQRLEAIAVSPDSRWLAIVSRGDVALIDLVNRSVANQFTVDIGLAKLAAFSDDGKNLVITNSGGITSTWDFIGGIKVSEVTISGLQINPVALSSNGKYLALVVNESELRVWDIENNNEIWSYTDSGLAYVDDPWNFVFSPNGDLLVFPVGDDGNYTIFATATGEKFDNPDGLGGVPGRIVFSPDGTLLAVSYGNGVVIWSAK